jgi:hypothetical protein
MDTLKEALKAFNSHSRDTVDHFKLCTLPTPKHGLTHEVKLCSSHPRLVTCMADSMRIYAHHTGPLGFRQTFDHDSASLSALLTLLHRHRDDTDTLLDWEMEDWVTSGYPCKLYTVQDQPYFPDLGFMPEDLWCIDEQPNRPAHI